MKTDLSKILSVSGQHGLYQYIAQGRSGAIVEALADKKRTAFSGSSRMTTLEDISIYTEQGELKLREVFEKLRDALGGEAAPEKGSADELKALFDKAVPDYDGNRFYVSHMKKVVDWYNQLRTYASLEFEVPSENGEAPEEA